MCIIYLENEKPQTMWLPYIVLTTHLYCRKANVLFFYSLFVHIIVNKAMFMVTYNINPIIINIIKYNINTTSLSHSFNYVVKWQSHLLIIIFL